MPGLTFLLPPPLREPGRDAFTEPRTINPRRHNKPPSPIEAWNSGPVTTYVSPLRRRARLKTRRALDSVTPPPWRRLLATKTALTAAKF